MKPVRVGIVGAGFGERVLVKAFRLAGADVVALATRSQKSADAAAQRLGIKRAYADWRKLVRDPEIEAVAIAVPPISQPAIALAALRSKKAVFSEKPLASTLSAARAMARAARRSGRTTAVDFELSEIPEWGRAEELIRQKALGKLRHVALVWHVETFANQNRLRSWKNQSRQGGGVLFSFASHSFNYLERFCGPIQAVMAHLSQAPDLPGPQDTLLQFTAECRGGILITGSVCSHAFLGSGHCLKFFGEKGTLRLENATDDYGKGFSLSLGMRGGKGMKKVPVLRQAAAWGDGRIAPVARLASRFLKACRKKGRMNPSFVEGLRVQVLLDACRRSSRLGRKVKV